MAFTLIVEDGSGMTTSNAFASNAEVTALLAAHPFADAWAACTVQDQCIAEASAWLSRLRWLGRQTLIGTQAMAWPRAWVPQPDRGSQATGQPFVYDYLYFASTIVPAFLKRATSRLALHLAQQTASAGGSGTSPYALTGLAPNTDVQVGSMRLTPAAPMQLPPDVLFEIRPMLMQTGVTAVRA